MYSKRHLLLSLWFGMLFVFQAFAWTSHQTAAFDLNGFDLAEQIRYHPAIKAESPTLRSSALLWLAIPLTAGGLTLAGSLYENRKARVLIWFLANLPILRLLPPQSTWGTSILEDDYARTLVILSLLGWMLCGLLLLLRPYYKNKIHWLMTALSFLASIVPLLGFRPAFQLLVDLGLDLEIGGGLWLYGLFGLLLLILSLRENGRLKQPPIQPD